MLHINICIYEGLARLSNFHAWTIMQIKHNFLTWACMLVAVQHKSSIATASVGDKLINAYLTASRSQFCTLIYSWLCVHKQIYMNSQEHVAYIYRFSGNIHVCVCVYCKCVCVCEVTWLQTLFLHVHVCDQMTTKSLLRNYGRDQLNTNWCFGNSVWWIEYVIGNSKYNKLGHTHY